MAGKGATAGNGARTGSGDSSGENVVGDADPGSGGAGAMLTSPDDAWSRGLGTGDG